MLQSCQSACYYNWNDFSSHPLTGAGVFTMNIVMKTRNNIWRTTLVMRNGSPYSFHFFCTRVFTNLWPRRCSLLFFTWKSQATSKHHSPIKLQWYIENSIFTQYLDITLKNVHMAWRGFLIWSVTNESGSSNYGTSNSQKHTYVMTTSYKRWKALIW